MTADDLLILARASGIVLEAQGDKLIVDAPVGTITPELRSQLARHKPALLELLTPVTRFVTLRNGPTLPAPALLLALDLQRRGFKMALDECQQFTIEPTAPLTDTDLAAISRWRLHLGAIVGYTCEVLA